MVGHFLKIKETHAAFRSQLTVKCDCHRRGQNNCPQGVHTAILGTSKYMLDLAKAFEGGTGPEIGTSALGNPGGTSVTP